MAGLLRSRRARNRLHDVAARVQRAGDALDVAALAGCIPAFVGDDDRDLLAVDLVVQVGQLRLEAVKLGLVLFIGDGLVERDVLKVRDRLEREGVLQDRNGERVVLERSVDRLVQEGENLQLGPFFVLRVDDVPGSRGAVGVLEVAVVDIEALVVVLVLPEIVFAYAPFRVLVREERVKAGLLLLLRDVEEEFHDQVAVVVQLSLGGVDAADALLVGGLVDRAVKHAVDDLLHPAGIEELELAGLRDLDEVAVEEGLSHFLLGRGGVGRRDAEEARVDVLDDIGDDAALAGGAPALKNDHDRELRILDLHLVGEQFFALLLEGSLDGLLVRLERLGKIFKHREDPPK